MSPQRIANSPELTFALIAYNIGWFAYLVAVPPQTFSTSLIWRGALGATPFHSPDLLGCALGLVSLLVIVSWFFKLRLLYGIALVWGMGTWGVLAYSFVFTALRTDGLGAGGAVSAAFSLFVHFFMLRHREV